MSEILKHLEEISQLLQTASDATTLAQQLGNITKTIGSEIVVRPKDDDVFVQLSVIAHPNASEPAHIRLRLIEPVAMSTLSAQFGEPRKAPTTSGGKRKHIFNAAYQGDSHNVTLIFEGSDETLDLVLRRDIRLG